MNPHGLGWRSVCLAGALVLATVRGAGAAPPAAADAPITAAAPAADAVAVRADFGRPLRTLRGGFGASWHAIETPIPVVGERSHGGSAWGGNPAADDEASWRQVYRHADWLGLDFLRVEVEQRMWQPAADRFDWESEEMRVLFRILDWCERRRADVFLQVMWGNVAWNAFPEFREDPVLRVHSGPASMEAFADGVAALVRHLVRERRYTCVRWLSINNEPGHDWSWWQRPPNTPMPLRDGLAAVRRALDREGLPVPLSGPDWTDLPEFRPEAVDFDEFVGAYDLHSYHARFDWWDRGPGYPLSQAENRLATWAGWANGKGKPLFLSELGTMAYGWGTNHPGPATFEAAIKDAELVVRGLAAGVEGFNRWSFVNRGDLDGQWQLIDTWDAARGRIRPSIGPHPNGYFVYGLITRFTARHSTLVTTERRGGRIGGHTRVHSAALRSPAGTATWILVNDADRPWRLQGDVAGVDARRLYRYQVGAADRDRPELRVEPVGTAIALRNGAAVFEETLPPFSLTVFSTRRLAAGERGLIDDGGP